MARAEVIAGKWQIEALSRTLSRFAGLHAGTAHFQHPLGDTALQIPYLYRPPASAPSTHPETAVFSASAEPPVVFLHGFGDSKELWLFIANLLNRRRPLLLVDLPGFGAATPIPANLTTMAIQSTVVAELLSVLGIEHAHLVGFSMGGGIALHVAKAHPERVRSLVLISALGPYVTPSELALLLERDQNPLIPKSFRETKAMLAFAAHRKLPLSRATVRFIAEQKRAVVDQLQSSFDHLMPELQTGYSEAGFFTKIAAPSLLICGQRDRVVHPDTSRHLAQILPQAQLAEWDNVGHLIPLEVPRMTARQVEAFLSTRF